MLLWQRWLISINLTAFTKCFCVQTGRANAFKFFWRKYKRRVVQSMTAITRAKIVSQWVVSSEGPSPHLSNSRRRWTRFVGHQRLGSIQNKIWTLLKIKMDLSSLNSLEDKRHIILPCNRWCVNHQKSSYLQFLFAKTKQRNFINTRGRLISK